MRQGHWESSDSEDGSSRNTYIHTCFPSERRGLGPPSPKRLFSMSLSILYIASLAWEFMQMRVYLEGVYALFHLGYQTHGHGLTLVYLLEFILLHSQQLLHHTSPVFKTRVPGHHIIDILKINERVIERTVDGKVIFEKFLGKSICPSQNHFLKY